MWRLFGHWKLLWTDNKHIWPDYVITTTSLIYSNGFVSVVENMIPFAGVLLLDWTISIALAKLFSLWRFVAHPTLSEPLPMLMQSRILVKTSRELIQGVLRGGGGCRVVTLSLRSKVARLNTSYSNTKSGCDVHTNEPIIGGFVTQFLHSFIWRKEKIPSWCPMYVYHSCFQVFMCTSRSVVLMFWRVW